MKTRPIYALLGFTSLSLMVLAAACGDDEETTTTGPTSGAGATTTTTTSTSTTSNGGAGGAGLDCPQLCSDLYDCGLEMDGGMQLCVGFSGDAAEKTAFIGDSMGGCIETCEGPLGPAVAGLIDPADCPGTIDSVKSASTDFSNVCDNGFGAGGAGGAGGGG